MGKKAKADPFWMSCVNLFELESQESMSLCQQEVLLDYGRKAWRALSYRQREMLKLSMGFHENRCYTPHEIADIFGITTSYAKRLIEAAQRQFIADTQAYKAEACES
jgi:DNA-binding CsgD family transcriptional regulator